MIRIVLVILLGSINKTSPIFTGFLDPDLEYQGINLIAQEKTNG